MITQFSAIRTLLENLMRSPFTFLLLTILSLSNLVEAHKVSSASAVLTITTEEDRTFELSVATAVESSGDATLDDEIGPVEAARIFVEENLLILIDEKEQPIQIETELVEETDDDTPSELKRMSVLVNWTGTLPKQGKEIAVYLDESSEMTIVLATVKNGTPKRRIQVIYPGEYTRAENIEPLLKENPFEISNPETKSTLPDSVTEIQPSEGFLESFKMGASAVFHNLWFPLCLLISFAVLVGSFRVMVIPLATFLVFQSIGIALTSTGLMASFGWSLSASIISLLILSIDNLLTDCFRKWRYPIGAIGAFFLGNAMTQCDPFLALGGPNLPISQFFPFQLGFDLVSLGIAAGLGLIFQVARNWKFYRNAIVVPISGILAGIAIYLLIS